MKTTRIEFEREGDLGVSRIVLDAKTEPGGVVWVEVEEVPGKALLLGGYFNPSTVSEATALAAKILGACDAVCYEPTLIKNDPDIVALIEAIAKLTTA